MEQNLFGNNPVLVTGASGLVGTHLIALLLQNNTKVRAFVRSKSAQNQCISILQILESTNIESNIEWFYGDICDLEDVHAAMNDCKYVFHCAGFVSFAKQDTKKLFEINHIGTQNIVQAALQNSICKLCYVSSVATLGKSIDGKYIDETCEFQKTKKTSPYNYSKYLAELEVWRGIAEGLQAVIVNPSVILGVSNSSQSSTALFGTVYKGLKYYTDGSTGYVSAWDLVTCMLQLMKSDVVNEKYIISAENIDYKTIFEFIAESLHVNSPKKKAEKWQIILVAIYFEILSKFTGKSPAINRYTVQSATRHTLYSNQKITSLLNFSFTPLHIVIQKIGNTIIKNRL